MTCAPATVNSSNSSSSSSMPRWGTVCSPFEGWPSFVSGALEDDDAAADMAMKCEEGG